MEFLLECKTNQFPMRLPSWNEINEKIGSFEKKTLDTIGKAKEGHPLVAAVIKGLIETVLPPPFDKIASNIYDDASGTEEDKTSAVLGYFKNLQMQGESHYDQIATKLDSVLIEIHDVKQITAKESTLQTIQEILISSSKTADMKLDLLRNDLKQINEKVDTIDKTTKDTNVKVTETQAEIKNLESRIDVLTQLQKQALDQYKIPIVVRRDEKSEIPSSMIADLENKDKEIKSLESEIEKLQQAKGIPTRLPRLVPSAADIDFFLKKGNAYLIAGNWASAIENYDRVLELDPNNYAVLSNKGHALSGLGKYEESIKCEDESLRINPKNAVALLAKGDSLKKLQRYNEAIKTYDEYFKIFPKNDQYRAFALSSKGNAIDESGNTQEGLRYYDEALKIQPNSPVTLCWKGLALINLDRPQEAIKYLDDAARLAPDLYTWPLTYKGLALAHLGRFDEALKSLDEVLRLNPNDIRAAKFRESVLAKIKSQQIPPQQYGQPPPQQQSQFTPYGRWHFRGNDPYGTPASDLLVQFDQSGYALRGQTAINGQMMNIEGNGSWSYNQIGKILILQGQNITMFGVTPVMTQIGIIDEHSGEYHGRDDKGFTWYIRRA